MEPKIIKILQLIYFCFVKYWTLFWICYWFPTLLVMLVTWASWINPEWWMEEVHGCLGWRNDHLQQKQCSRANCACAFMTDDRWRWKNDNDEMAMMNNDGQMMVDEFLVKQKCTCNSSFSIKRFIILITFTFTIKFPLIRNNIPGVMTFDTRKR